MDDQLSAKLVLGPAGGSQTVAIVHWSANPNLGLPERYLIEVCREPGIISSDDLKESSLGPGAPFRISDVFPAWARGDSVIAISAEVHSPSSSGVIFGTALDGHELVGTRFAFSGGGSQTPIVLIADGLVELHSTQPITLRNMNVVLSSHFEALSGVALRGLKDNDYDVDQIIENNRVARREFLSDAPEWIQHIDLETWDWETSEAIRSSDLANFVRQFAFDTAAPLLVVPLNSGGDQGVWSIPPRPSPPRPPPVEVSLNVAETLQFVALSGPAEAMVCGHSFTFDPQSSFLFAGIPLVRVTGRFPNGNNGGPITVSSLAHLVGQMRPRVIGAQALPPIPPQERDQPAFADIEIALEASSIEFGGAIFLSENGAPRLNYGGMPKPFVPAEVKVHRAPRPGGPPVEATLTRILDPHVEVPVAGQPPSLSYEVAWRDQFGRFLVENVRTVLELWPVTVPSLLAARITYSDTHAVSLEVDIAWDWTYRSPAEIRLGLQTGVAFPETSGPRRQRSDPQKLIVSPEAHPGVVSAPAFEGGVTPEIKLIFKADEGDDQEPTPSVVGLRPEAPAVTLSRIPAQVGTSSEGQQRIYRLNLPIGEAGRVGWDEDGRCLIAVVADGAERVDRTRHSARSRTLVAQAFDPRPPQLRLFSWRLFWASRPDPSGRSRAWAKPETQPGPAVRGYHVWRAHESALIDLIVTTMKRVAPSLDLGPSVDLLRHESNMTVRRDMLKALYDQAASSFIGDGLAGIFSVDGTMLHEPNEGAEIVLPGHLTGLELISFTAISATGVQSERGPLLDFAVVAVPKQPRRSRPSMKVLTSDVLAPTGMRLLLVTSPDPFVDDEVHFYRAEGLIVSGEEALFPLDRYWPVSMSEARGYVDNPDHAVGPAEQGRFFLAQPTPTWGYQSLVAEIRNRGSEPADQIPSARSIPVSCVVLPSHPPRMTVEQTGAGSWSVNIEDAPRNVPAEIGDSVLYISLRKDGDETPFGPYNLREAPIEVRAGSVPTLIINVEPKGVGTTLRVAADSTIGWELVLGCQAPNGRVAEVRIYN